MEKSLEQESQQLLFRRIDALRFYGGDTRVRGSNGYMGMGSQDAMYGDKNAYRTLNALLFEGVRNKQERIWTEGHILNTEFIRRIDETVQIYMDIFTLMKEKSIDFDSGVVGRRIERASSIAYYENGFTQSFFSCSKSGFDRTFAQKSDIVLIEMELVRNVPFIDYEKILSRREYKHWDEREILLPPFLNIEIIEIPLTVSETRRVKDLNKRPPQGKYRLKAVEFPDYRKSIFDSEKIIWQQIIEGKESAAHLLEMMNKRDKEQDYEEYTGWKEKLHQYLKIQFSNIWYGGDKFDRYQGTVGKLYGVGKEGG